MGLDITAYAKVEKSSFAGTREEFWDGNGGMWIENDAAFASHADGLLGPHIASGEAFGFRAGSYSGYNRWREQLARMVGTSPESVWASFDASLGVRESSFAWLIHFSDCEGVIGPKTSARLLADFKKHTDLVQQVKVRDDDGWFAMKYADWTKAFQIASGGGCVRFH